MAQLIYTAGALADLDRLADFLIEAEPVVAIETAELIIEAIQVLANHPLVGRAAEKDCRDLVISRGHTGYVALYSYEQSVDAVLILSIRHLHEAGFSEETMT